jgi:hypothetical protein
MNPDKILKASNVRKEHPIYKQIAEELSTIDQLKFVKIYNGRVLASNILSDNGKKEPIVNVGEDGIVGTELLVDESNKVVQFFAITSSEKGCGEMMVKSVVNTVPDDWTLAVVMDWSGGFWEVMTKRYPRLVVF